MEKAGAMLVDLKARYHTFRALLANNELSLDLLKHLEQFFASGDHHGADFEETVDELLSVTYEMIDGLNYLSGAGNGALYQKHRALSDGIRQTLANMMASTPSSGPLCVFFDQIPGQPGLQVGAKAASMAFLKRAGFAVPDGFVMTPAATREYLSANGVDTLIRQQFSRMLPGGGFDELERDAEKIRESIMGGFLPERLRDEMRRCYEQLASQGGAVSVRSSALVEDRPEHSFAGQFKTVLNVTSPDSFEKAYREVLASNFSVRVTTYRIHAGLPSAGDDMAVICQRMVDAKAAGVLFTVDPVSPASGRMVISAVPGLGTSAVSGAAPADIYRPLRENPESEPMREWAQVAEKTHSIVADSSGGVRREDLPQGESSEPVLPRDLVLSLVRSGRKIEGLTGAPQDIEWAVSKTGELFILQSREIRIAIRKKDIAESVRGKVLMRAGVCASPGRCVGRVKVIRSREELENWRETSGTPKIMVLGQSLVDAAGRLPEAVGVIVDMGNPADHLSCVAREYGHPMITGAVKATGMLNDGDWIILDADRTTIYEAPEAVRPEAVRPDAVPAPAARERKSRTGELTPDIARLRDLIEPLNLTDAYGPTFSIHECRSIHDLIRYTHEMAIMAMFEAGDTTLEGAGVLVRRLKHDIPLHFMIIDLGGGIAPRARGTQIDPEDVLSRPFQAFWDGVMTPGLRWNAPPPTPSISGLFSRAMLDGRSARPVGGQNYALVTRDYLNLNARVEYHFTMVDSICGLDQRENAIRFRFKGGGTATEQRERRTRFIAEILKAYAFETDLRGDLLTASIAEVSMEEVQERLIVIGRLLGFTRLLDAAMQNDQTASKITRAFLEGDYGLEGLGL